MELPNTLSLLIHVMFSQKLKGRQEEKSIESYYHMGTMSGCQSLRLLEGPIDAPAVLTQGIHLRLLGRDTVF